MDIQAKIMELAKLIEHDQINSKMKSGYDSPGNIFTCRTNVIPKKKYTCLDIGDSGRYMIENETGVIYGIKKYGVINKTRKYCTLDTIYNFHWGEYYPMSGFGCRPKPDNYLTVINQLEQLGFCINNDKLCEIGKIQEEPIKIAKTFGPDKYRELLNDLSTAYTLASIEADKVEDNGTCNLDGIILRLPSFKEKETLEAISKSKLSGFKMKHPIYGIGYNIGLCVGQANKREKAAKTMYNYFKHLGYDVSHYQQMD